MLELLLLDDGADERVLGESCSRCQCSVLEVQGLDPKVVAWEMLVVEVALWVVVLVELAVHQKFDY